MSELNARGFTDSQIARKLHLSVPWVNRLRRSMGLPVKHTPSLGPRKWDPAKARALYDQGLMDRQVAEHLGVSREVIQKWRRAEGLPTNR